MSFQSQSRRSALRCNLPQLFVALTLALLETVRYWRFQPKEIIPTGVEMLQATARVVPGVQKNHDRLLRAASSTPKLGEGNASARLQVLNRYDALLFPCHRVFGSFLHPLLSHLLAKALQRHWWDPGHYRATYRTIQWLCDVRREFTCMVLTTRSCTMAAVSTRAWFLSSIFPGIIIRLCLFVSKSWRFLYVLLPYR